MSRQRPPTNLSPTRLPCVVDNSVVSALHQANALARVLGLWPGRWVIPRDVKDEAAEWEAESQRIVWILDDLCKRGIAVYAEIDLRQEGQLFASLSRTLGKGEAATIAIAHQRHFGAALDDRAARRACERLNPPVPWLATEEILSLAIAELHLTLTEARDIWAATGILDPKRQLF
ncbi:MAG: hypothetical protein HY690_08035 [Chloroflexi bacterium]|nr:hypothetical protein [Chloroflexota bacterium]